MRLLSGVSIRNFLMGAVGLLVLILCVLSLNNVRNAYNEGREIARMETANEMADFILTAAGFEAKERGMTAMVLASDKAADPAFISKIHETREKGEEALKKAREHAKEFVAMDPGNTAFTAAMKRADEAYSLLNAARAEADRNLSLDAKNYPAKEWIKATTGFIEANAEARLAAFSSRASKETLQEALRMNLELKQSLWLVGEYAGRERATLSSFISASRPLDAATAEKLNTFRAIVDINVKPILRFKDTAGADPEAVKSISKMEEVFLGRFSQTRAGVYAAASTGRYPLDGKEWIERSSEAIDTVVAASNAVGAVTDRGVTAELAASKRTMAASIALLALIIAGGAASMWVINDKVIRPMRYLSGAMKEIAETGDLTRSIEVESSDESGRMAESFNAMMSRFHGIIREVHVSIELLASAAEELSASAVQIAGGSEAQSARAAQVSTATHEMNATIIEVAKNVAGASGAAKEASSVAEKGGRIVEDTIHSMEGISTTATESSRIIETLGGRSTEIGNIINVIDDIADQTNLLALNAAIEAARAGEQGRGFAVVADEVRKLAEKTMTATKEIGGMIKAMQDETEKAITSMQNEVGTVNNGVKLAQEAGSALREIVAKVGIVSDMVQQVTTATEEQSAATEQISGDIESVANVIRETSSSAQQIAKASQEVAELASNLRATIEIFKVTRAAAGDEAHREPGGNVVQMAMRRKAA